VLFRLVEAKRVIRLLLTSFSMHVEEGNSGQSVLFEVAQGCCN